MAALASLSTKIFARTNGGKAQPSSRLTLLGRSGIGFPPFPSFKNVHSDHLVLFPPLDAARISRCHVSSDTQVSTGFDTEVPGIQKLQPSKSVRVKFKLQKKCMFGEQFLLVGDHPLIGSWNPTNAIPLSWSDGDTWSVEMDVPVETTIQYKFILKQKSGEIYWQPGPDRILKTWECKNNIVIAEDWENPQAQKITEESSDQLEELGMNPDLEMIVPGNVSYTMEELMHNVNGIGLAAENSTPNTEFLTRESMILPGEGRLTVGNRIEETLINNNPRILTAKPLEDVESSFSQEEGPVLVPGMAPLEGVSAEAAVSKEFGTIMSEMSAGIDDAKDQNMPEVTS